MGKILIVDDSLFARISLCKLLADSGHEIIEAANGWEGVEMTLAHRPDFILSDLLMPELDGIGFITALRKQQISTPVVVLTADIQDTKRRECLQLGVLDFLHKPPKKEELLRLVESALSTERG